MLRNRSRLLAPFAVLVAAALTLGACGSDKKEAKKDTGQGDATTTTVPESTTTTTAAPTDTSTTTPDTAAPPDSVPEETVPEDDGIVPDIPEVEPEVDEAWYANPYDFDWASGETHDHNCPGLPDPELLFNYYAFGTGPYESDSSICLAAVHAGVISVRSGGTVKVRTADGVETYGSSTANGVTTEETEDPGRDFTSFTFVR